MVRPPSYSGAPSGSTSGPRVRLGFFKKRSSSSANVLRDEHAHTPPDKIQEPQQSEKILSPLTPPELELSRSNGLSSPDSVVAVTQDAEYIQLRENIRRIRKPSAMGSKKAVPIWETYGKYREESLQICKSLLKRSRKEPLVPLTRFALPASPRLVRGSWIYENGVNLIDSNSEGHNRTISNESSNLSQLDMPSSNNSSINEPSLPSQPNSEWLALINEYKAVQVSILESLRTNLLATYKAYEPGVSRRQLDNFLADKNIRTNLIYRWRDESDNRMKSDKAHFWDEYLTRSSNFDIIKQDLQMLDGLFSDIGDDDAPRLTSREYVIAKQGDTILEFANAASERHPILRFLVSSHLLAAASPLFSQFLSPHSESNPPLDLANELPPPPTKQTYKDGMEVNVFRMPQIERNNHNALIILLYAAHMQHDNVPRQIDFPSFVSIAEVCLRYRCTSPLELQVEYQWLPQFIHMLGDDGFDGFLLIAYTFGLRRIFKRMSKTAILNASGDEDIQNKELWPQLVRDRIKATRAAKLAQIHECCIKAVAQYFRAPSEGAKRRSNVGSLQLTSLPRCPRGSHACDATNLGWLMLVYNELQILPSILKDVGFNDLPRSPKRSLRELVDCLRLVPSAPQAHGGVCDYAAAFRSDVNDIYNSVTGLTLRDVSGRSGWALSKHAGLLDEPPDTLSPDIVELEASLEFSPRASKTRREVAMSNEDISLRILSNLDDMDDLSSAAMIDKSFYHTYKRNEALLLKNVMKAEKRKTQSQATHGVKYPQPAIRIADDSFSNDLYDASPIFPLSPMTGEIPMSEEEAQRILWPDDHEAAAEPTILGDISSEANEKFRLNGFVHIEEKIKTVGDGEKHLRDEKDRELRLCGVDI